MKRSREADNAIRGEDSSIRAVQYNTDDTNQTVQQSTIQITDIQYSNPSVTTSSMRPQNLNTTDDKEVSEEWQQNSGKLQNRLLEEQHHR